MLRPDRLRRAVHGHPHAADAAVAAIAYGATLLTTLGSLLPGMHRLGVAEPLVAAVTCGALIVRRRWPFAVLAVAAAGAVGYMVLSPDRGWALAAPLVALYSAAEATGRRRALTVGWVTVLLLAFSHALIRPGWPWFGPENLTMIALGGLAVAAGDAARSRRAYIAEVEERARRAERDREQEAARRVTEERLRIARDLHDSLGHQLALINVQAGAAGAVMDVRPEQARDAVELIGQASRAALDELGNTVGLLRGPGEPAAPTGPVGLAGLDDLIASFGKAGLRIEHLVDGRVRPLPPATDATAYRVIEESLTNVRRHAGDAVTRIRLDYGPSAVHVLVEDEGGGTGAVRGAGHGLVGMRERVTAAGGRLDAGPRRGGGFRVSAFLPLPDGGRSQ